MEHPYLFEKDNVMLKDTEIRIIKMLLGIILISLGMPLILKAGLDQSTEADAYSLTLL